MKNAVMYSGLKRAMKGRKTTEEVQSTNARKKQRSSKAVLCSRPKINDVLQERGEDEM